MKEYSDILGTAVLFRDIDPSALPGMLDCLGARAKKISKGEYVLLAGESPRHVGIVLSGRLHIVRENAGGNRLILAAVTPGELFAEALCCAGISESPVSVIADSDSTVCLLGFPRILHTCPSSCAFHTQLIENMLGIIANKTLQLQSRLEIIGLKSIRAKVLSYLSSLCPCRNLEITIPFNREELADYLCVERSALSHELSRMRKDGLLEYRKNKFLLTGKAVPPY